MSVIKIIHFNDVYRVTPQKLPGSERTISVSQFAAIVQREKEDDHARALVLFSGDLFSPSVESTVTRGSHMVPIMNTIGPDIALTGNHDFDFGYPHLTRLIKDSTYPWILSNIVDTNTGKVPDALKEYHIVVRDGVKIGVIGLVEREWIATVSSWPESFQWVDMVETGCRLSRLLRDPNGPNCDLIIALTHCRLPNDIKLAKSLFARTSETDPSVAQRHGVDILLGGHDHMYYVSKGCAAWQNHDQDAMILGASEDDGVLLVKSGTDFRDLSILEIALDHEGSGVRRRTIHSVQGKHRMISPDDPHMPAMQELVENVVSSVGKVLDSPLCYTKTILDVRSKLLRVQESAAANWFADVARHSYDDALSNLGFDFADGVLLAAGTLRGDSTYGPGVITLGNILEILPFEDPMLVLQLDGASLYEAIESALSTWPAQEGRFPVISGFRVRWDSSRPAGNRVISIYKEESGSNTPISGRHHKDGTLIAKDGKTLYTVVTRQYMADGHDGFVALKGKKHLVDDELGQLFSTIVRRYLLGSRFITAVNQSMIKSDTFLHDKTLGRLYHHTQVLGVGNRWRALASRAIRKNGSGGHYRDLLTVAQQEHMSPIDCFDGASVRKGDFEGFSPRMDTKDQLPVIRPAVDGRLKDVAQ